MNDKIEKEVFKLPPFKRMCMTIGELPSSYLETMSYYEMLVWFTKYLGDTVIPTINNNAEAVSELQTLFTELQDYVNNYFDNLDVQEEINNKLDKMAQDGTLEEILGEYYNYIDGFKNPVQYIFPKFISNGWSGDCNLIKYKNKNILIDTHGSAHWEEINQFLIDNEARFIDYLIISHYDSDHVGNVENLINNNYINNNTIVFLPIVPSQFSDALITENNIKALLTNNNISFTTPVEKQEEIIDDNFKMIFGNLNRTYMEANYTQYNATSMVVLFKHHNTQAFYSSDAFQQTFKYLYDNNFITSSIDLYKQAHHGIDTRNNFMLLDEIMSPSNVVQCGGIKDLVKNNFFCEETSFLINKGCRYYPTYFQNNYLKFNSNGYSVNCINGKTASFSGQRIGMDLYVDINASLNYIQDGTQEHPFSELMEAIGFIKNFPSGDYTIHLANGNYGYSHEAGGTNPKNIITISPNNNINVIIEGNSNDNTAVVLHQIRIYNTNVTLKNLTVDNTDNDAIGCYHSYLFINNCNITSINNINNNHAGVWIGSGSTLTLRNSNISYCNYGVSINEGSYYSYDNNTFSNITLKNVRVNDSYACVKDIKNNDSGLDTILKDNYTQYDWLEMRFRSNDGIMGSIKVTSPSDNLRIGVEIPYTSTSGVSYDKRAIFTLNSGNKITKSSLYQITTGTDGSVSVSEGANNLITIQQVWAGYND